MLRFGFPTDVLGIIMRFTPCYDQCQPIWRIQCRSRSSSLRAFSSKSGSISLAWLSASNSISREVSFKKKSSLRKQEVWRGFICENMNACLQSFEPWRALATADALRNSLRGAVFARLLQEPDEGLYRLNFVWKLFNFWNTTMTCLGSNSKACLISSIFRTWENPQNVVDRPLHPLVTIGCTLWSTSTRQMGGYCGRRVEFFSRFSAIDIQEGARPRIAKGS